MNYLTTSTGERISRTTFDNRIREAKRKKLLEQVEIHGYNFCTRCERNDCLPIDVSHIISVDKCIKKGIIELAYDLNNLQILGRDCHKKYDGLDLRFTKKDRQV